MTMHMNSTGVTNENDIHGFRSPQPGRYLAVVKNVDESYSKGDWIGVEFEILAGTVPGQEGMKHTENMFLRDGGASDQHVRFAIVTGLLQAGTEAEVNLQNAVGRQLIIGLEKRKSKNNDKEYTNIGDYGMAMWSLTNPEVADVPRLPPAGQQAASPQGQQPQQTYQQPPQGQPQAPQYQAPQQQMPPQQSAPQYAPPPAQQPAPATQQGGGGWADI